MRHYHPAQQGFALAAVLWLMAGLSIVVALVGDATRTSAERVAQLRQRTAFLRNAYSARAQAEYWLTAARPRTADFFDGAHSILADDTPYQTDPDTSISLQDTGGLIDLNRTSGQTMLNFLIGCGVPQEQAPFLADALADYVDSDDLHRINGAEKDSYAAKGLEPPRNGNLLSEAEVWNVYGWKPYRDTMERNGCASSMTVEGETTLLGSRLNLATAPPPVLKATGLSDDIIADISRNRADPEKIAERASLGNDLLGGGGLFGAGRQVQKILRVTHRSLEGPWTLTYTLTLDPDDDDRPWSITHPVMSAQRPTVGKLPLLSWPTEAPPAQSGDAPRRLPF